MNGFSSGGGESIYPDSADAGTSFVVEVIVEDAVGEKIVWPENQKLENVL